MKFFRPYTQFSQVYDQSMENVDYREWVRFFLDSVLDRKLPIPGAILDLGCGTGRFGILLVEAMGERIRYDGEIHYVGVDSSAEMIGVARRNSKLSVSGKNLERKPQIRWEWIVSPVEKLVLLDQFDWILSTHTTINYLSDLKNFLELAWNQLPIGGVLFFDFTSKRNILKNFHHKEFEEIHGGTKLVWNTEFFEKSKQIEVVLDFYSNSTGDFLGREVHSQYYYEVDEILKLMNRVGFRQIYIGGDYRFWEEYASGSHGRLKKSDMYHIMAIKG